MLYHCDQSKATSTNRTEVDTRAYAPCSMMLFCKRSDRMVNGVYGLVSLLPDRYGLAAFKEYHATNPSYLYGLSESFGKPVCRSEL